MDTKRNTVTRHFAVLAIALGLLAGLLGLAAPAGAATTDGLSEPSCYSTGMLWWKKTDCSARDLWRQVRPMLDSGAPDQTAKAVAAVLAGPAAGAGFGNVVDMMDYRPRCAAEGINAYLKRTVSNQTTVSNGRTALDYILRAAGWSRVPGVSQYAKVLREGMPSLWNAVVAIGRISVVRATFYNMMACSA